MSKPNQTPKDFASTVAARAAEMIRSLKHPNLDSIIQSAIEEVEAEAYERGRADAHDEIRRMNEA